VLLGDGQETTDDAEFPNHILMIFSGPTECVLQGGIKVEGDPTEFPEEGCLEDSHQHDDDENPVPPNLEGDSSRA